MPNLILGTDTTVNTKLITKNVEPEADNIYDIGTSSKKYNNIYMSGDLNINDKFSLTANGEIKFGSSSDEGTDGAVLISRGIGNQVEWRTRVICTAYLPNSITVTRATETDMMPMTVEIELGSGSYGYNATTGEYTVPLNGIYSVHYSVGFLDDDNSSTGAGAMNHARCSIWIDSGSGYAQKYTYTAKNSGLYDDNRLHSSVTAVIDLSQGDKLLCRVGYFASDSDSQMVGGNSPAYCFQHIHLIG